MRGRREDEARRRRFAAEDAALAAAGDGWKPNKLRKKTFAKLGDTDLTWSDFKDCLEKLVRAGKAAGRVH